MKQYVHSIATVVMPALERWCVACVCSLIFSSWTYDGFQVNLTKVGEEGDVSNYKPNSEWSLIKLHAERHVLYYRCV